MKNKHVKSFEELNENKNLNVSDVSESIFDRSEKNDETFIFKGMGETYGFFKGKKWVYVYENPKTGKIKVSDKKIDKYHTGDNDE